MPSLRAFLLFAVFLFTISTNGAPVPPNYALVPSNFLWDAVPNSIPTLKAQGFIVTNVARLVNYGALAMFDATTKCLNFSVGPFTGTAGKRALGEIQDPGICGAQNKTVAQAYAFYLVTVSEYPQLLVPLSGFLASIGLDVSPDTLAQANDYSTDVMLGLATGYAMRAFAAADGVNSQGNLNGEIHNKREYYDYTHYGEDLQNTAYDWHNCNQWQPSILDYLQSTGYYVQEPISPQTRFAWSTQSFNATAFVDHFDRNDASCKGSSSKRALYRQQAWDVVYRVGNLTDYKKMQGELFEDKLDTFFYGWATFRFTIPGPYSGQVPWTADDDVYFLAVGDAAGYAGGVGAWQVKYYTKSVRPRSVIKNYLVDETIYSWGGPYQGTVLMNASDYESYLPTMGHPSYPSGTTCFTEALVASWKHVLDTDALPVPINVTKLAGSSLVEPAVPSLFGHPGRTGTPATDIYLVYPTLSDYAHFAGESRMDIGVHFEADVASARVHCPPLGKHTATTIQEFLLGTRTTVFSVDDRDFYSSTYDPLKAVKWFK